MTVEQIDAVRAAFRILFRDGMVLSGAIDRLERELGSIDVIQEMIVFLRDAKRGISPMRDRREAA